MIKLKELTIDDFEEYFDLYHEFINSSSSLVPDILEMPCNNINDYTLIIEEIKRRKSGNHDDIDWYLNSYYYLFYDDNNLIGLGCLRDKLTDKGFNIWGHLALGIRPNMRKKSYATSFLKLLINKAKDFNIDPIIVCHYEENKITPKILNKINAEYLNEVVSPYSKKTIKRYKIK